MCSNSEPCPRCGKPVEQTSCMVTDEFGKDVCRACKPKRLEEIIEQCRAFLEGRAARREREKSLIEQYRRCGFVCDAVKARRAINSKGDSRGAVPEYIITGAAR